MIYEFTIPRRLPGLNEYIDAEREHRLKAAKIKRECEELIISCIRVELGRLTITSPVELTFHFFEKDRRRDKDNISGYAHKVIQDSLVKAKVLKNDGWNEIESYKDYFSVDSKRPRVEVMLIVNDMPY